MFSMDTAQWIVPLALAILAGIMTVVMTWRHQVFGALMAGGCSAALVYTTYVVRALISGADPNAPEVTIWFFVAIVFWIAGVMVRVGQRKRPNEAAD